MSVKLKLAQGMDEVLAEEARLARLGPEATARFWSQNEQALHAVEDFSYPGADGQPQRLRLFRASPDTRPTLIYIHGGGWVEGSIELNEPAARALAAQSGRHVVSISYRFAPEHTYPAALSDCIAAVRWLQSDSVAAGLKRHVDIETLAIGGASAGANLALATALSLPLNTFDALLLFYGVFDDDMSTPSYSAHRDGPGMTQDRMKHIFQSYDPECRRRTDPLITPLQADLQGLPPAIIAAAEIDVLRSENETLADRLRAAGVDVTFWVEQGVTHGYINRGRLLPAARVSLTRAAETLQRLNS